MYLKSHCSWSDCEYCMFLFCFSVLFDTPEKAIFLHDEQVSGLCRTFCTAARLAKTKTIVKGS